MEKSQTGKHPDVGIGEEENSDSGSVTRSDNRAVEKHVTLPLNLESDDETVKETNEQVVSKETDTHNVTDKSEKESNLSQLKGRLVRKSTEPRIPINPIKKPRISASPASNSTISKDQQQNEEDSSSQQEIIVKENEENKIKEFLVKCKRNEQGNASQQEIMVIEDGEEIYKNSVERKRQHKESMVVNIGELLPEGSVSVSDIQLKLDKGTEIELKLKYSPQEF